MLINRYESDLLKSNMYVVSHGNHHLVVDPCRMDPVGEGDVVDYIVLTHEHYDHISGVLHWKERFPEATVLCSVSCAKNIKNPRKSLASYFELLCEMQDWIEAPLRSNVDSRYSCEADLVFDEEHELEWMGHHMVLFELPGHSEGSIGLIIDEQHFFAGDSLIPNNTIDTRLPGGSRDDWVAVSLPKLRSIDLDTMVYPGHFLPGSMRGFTLG